MKCLKKQDVFHSQIRRTSYIYPNFSNDKDFCDSWEGQKELEKIVSNRKLNIPRTTKFSVILLIGFLIILLIGFVFSIIYIPFDFYLKIIVIISFALLFIEVGIRILSIWIIKCYQHYAKEETRRRCLCIPSCSEYSIMCLKKYPLTISYIKIYKRLFKTCKGEMYLIDKP